MKLPYLISRERLRELQEKELAHDRAVQASRWFAEWEELDILWKFILEGTDHVSTTREEFRKAKKD